MSIWPFRRNEAQAGAKRLLEAVAQASRRPDLYGPGRVPDTLQGRFELLTLHAALALSRLQAAPEARQLAQNFTDILFRHIDSGLREAGVGDLTVPKRMRKLAGDFYGRVQAYGAVLNMPEAFSAAILRNVLGDEGDPAFAARLAAYAGELARRQGEMAPEALPEPKAWAAVLT